MIDLMGLSPYDLVSNRGTVLRTGHCSGNGRHIKPIPLTSEILKSAGFCYYSDKNDQITGKWKLNDEDLTLLKYPDHQGFFLFGNSSVYIEYVHELQELLRLCGKKYTADNLKV